MAVGMKQSKSDIGFDIINISLLTLVLIIVLYPLLFVISASLSDPSAVLNGEVTFYPKGFTLDAYMRVFQNKDIMMGYKNTIVYTLVGTTVSLVMTILGAYPLSRKDFVGRGILTMMVTFTLLFSAGMVPTYMVIKQLGLVNNFWVMVLPSAITVTNLIIMRTFFQNTIPSELYEAAFIDGCNNIRTLISIVIPLSGPVIAVMVLFYGVHNWNAFFNALIYLKDRSKFPLQLILREILIQSKVSDMVSSDDAILKQQLLFETLKYAIIVVASVPVLMLYPFIQQFFVKGVMVGAVKG